MSLLSKFSSEFESAIRSRGRSYYNDGLVRITQGDDQSVVATVYGSEKYRVILSIEGQTLKVSCSCPYFDMDVCKHIWATLIAAEARGLLGATPEPTRLRMSGDDEDDEDDFDDEDDEYDEDDEPAYNTSYTRMKAAAKPSSAAPALTPRAALWKRQLAFLNQPTRESGAYQIDHWPAGRELIYVIDGTMTKANKELVIEILHRDHKPNGEWSKPKAQHFTASLLNRLSDAQDRRLVALLFGAREPGSYYSGFPVEDQRARHHQQRRRQAR